MDSLAEKLNIKLYQWQPNIAEQVRQSVAEIIEMADQDTLDVSRSRAIEQEVLDLLDEPEAR
jgi:shikimate kinase